MSTNLGGRDKRISPISPIFVMICSLGGRNKIRYWYPPPSYWQCTARITTNAIWAWIQYASMHWCTHKTPNRTPAVFIYVDLLLVYTRHIRRSFRGCISLFVLLAIHIRWSQFDLHQECANSRTMTTHLDPRIIAHARHVTALPCGCSHCSLSLYLHATRSMTPPAAVCGPPFCARILTIHWKSTNNNNPYPHPAHSPASHPLFPSLPHWRLFDCTNIFLFL